MQISFVNRLLHYDPTEIGAYFKEKPQAEVQYQRHLNDSNLRQSVIFLYLIMASQLIVAVARWAGELGFPYYNISLIALCGMILVSYRASVVRHRATVVWFTLFLVWAMTFPFFIVRLGGYDSPTYPVYLLVVLYVVVFFCFSLRQYAFILLSILLSHAFIGYLQPNVSIDSFTYRQIVMTLFVVVALAGAYIQTHLRRKEFYQQRILEEKTEELAAALHELEEKELQLIQSEKMAALGKLTAGLAHEVNNPLNFITGNLDLMKEDLQTLSTSVTAPSTDIKTPIKANNDTYATLLQQMNESIEACKRGSFRIQKIIQDLRTFSRLDEAEWKVVDIRECIQSALSVLESRLKNVTVEIRNSDRVPSLGCYPAQLSQLFHCLLENAVDVIEPLKGRIEISTTVSDGNVQVEISDNGPGIPDYIQSRIFDPFFTTKDVGRGSGVGLAIAHGIALRHKGRLTFQTAAGKGTTFCLEIPLN
jgi:signal transduction histidine kinase